VSNIFGKLRDFVGLNGSADYDYDYDEMEGEDYQDLYQSEHSQALPARREEETRGRATETGLGSNMNSTMSNVVGMPGAGKWWGSVAEVIVMEPRAFEEMPQVIQALRERKSVVLNLTMMDPDQAQRAVDFIAGATYTIDGHQERIGESIFLFTPSCVQVSTQSGVVHEVSQPQIHTPRTPAPAWVGESAFSRIAQ
jgi:cell division inhibitor SepF